MLKTACDRIEQFCKDHLPVVNKKRVIPKLRHQESMAVMVMEHDTPPNSPVVAPLQTQMSTSSSEDDEFKEDFEPSSIEKGSYTTSTYVKRPQPGIPRIRRQTEMRLASMSAK